MRDLAGVRTSTFSGRGSSRRTFIVNSGQVLLMGAGLVAGLGRARMVGAASQVTIGMASVPCQAPTYAALAQGYFEDEGLQPTAWAEANRTETAELMRSSMTLPAQREISRDDMEAALAMQAFVPMADAARPILISEFDDYMAYGLPVSPSMDAATLVNRIFVPLTDELSG